MSRETATLKLYLPEDNEFYDVEKDQNDNFTKLDSFAASTNDQITALKKTKSDTTHTHDERYYTESEVDALFKKYCPYSVGDILLTESVAHPATRWLGTTWVRIIDCTLMGAGNLYAVGTKGGTTTVKLGSLNLPTHTHNYSNSINWAHSHTYSNHVNWNHSHTSYVAFETAHTHYYSNSINWSHTHTVNDHSHWIAEHQHIVPWGESKTTYEWGTYGSNNLKGQSAGVDFDNNWMYTSPSAAGWSGGSTPGTSWAGGDASFSGNTGSGGGRIEGTFASSAAGNDTWFSGTTSAQGSSATFSGNTGSAGNGQAFSILNPYYAVYIWKRTA